jgi:hypothetical protein
MRMASRVLALALITFAAACGDDGGSTPPDAQDQPDAEAQPDAGPACTAATFGAQDPLDGFDMGNFAAWGGPATADLGDGGDVIYQIEFYGSIETSLVGTFDLAEGNQNNYRTCAICFRVFSLDAKGALARQFFQSGGSVTLTEDPLTGEMVGNVSGLTLVEVEIAGDFTSTPVAGGGCVDHDALALDANLIPSAWTCDDAAFNDGANCDCGCGAADPDCDVVANPIVGCDAGDVCIDAVCTETCDVLASPPEGCTDGTCGYYTATEDICYTDPAVVDAAAIDAACTTGFLCGVSSTVALGVCDAFANDDNVCREACDATGDCDALEVCSAIGGIAPKGICVATPANDTCGTATPVVLGTPVTGSTGGGTADYNAGLEGATCTGFSQAGADVAYQLVLAADTSITVTLSDVSPNFDPSVALLGPGVATICDADPITTCVAGADDGLTADGETFTYAATAGTYFIIVDAFGATDTGSYTLTVAMTP